MGKAYSKYALTLAYGTFDVEVCEDMERRIRDYKPKDGSEKRKEKRERESSKWKFWIGQVHRKKLPGVAAVSTKALPPYVNTDSGQVSRTNAPQSPQVRSICRCGSRKLKRRLREALCWRQCSGIQQTQQIHRWSHASTCLEHAGRLGRPDINVTPTVLREFGARHREITRKKKRKQGKMMKTCNENRHNNNSMNCKERTKSHK